MRTVRTPLFFLSGRGALVEVVLALGPVNGLLARVFQRTGRTLCARTIVLVLPAVAGVLLAFARVVEVTDLLANGAKRLADSRLTEGPVVSSSRQGGGRLLTVRRGLIALLDSRVRLSAVTAGGDAGHRGLRTRGGVAPREHVGGVLSVILLDLALTDLIVGRTNGQGINLERVLPRGADLAAIHVRGGHRTGDRAGVRALRVKPGRPVRQRDKHALARDATALRTTCGRS